MRDQAKEFCESLLDNGHSIYEVEDMFPYLCEFEEEFPDLKEINREDYKDVIWDTWENRKLKINCFVHNFDDCYNIRYSWNVVLNDPRHLGLCNNFIYKFIEFTKFDPQYKEIKNKHLVFAPENEWLNHVSLMFAENPENEFELEFSTKSLGFAGKAKMELDNYLISQSLVDRIEVL